MKTVQFILISLVLSIGLATVNNTALAQKVPKLVAAPDGMRNKARMAADIVTDTIIVGAHAVDFNELDGFANIFTRNGNKWEKTAEVFASDRNKDNPGQAAFGFAVAIVGPPGRGGAEYAIIGAPSAGGQQGASEDGGGAYIYAPSGKQWKEQVKLAPQDLEKGDAFGWAVDITRTTAVVGVPKDDDAGRNSGSVYIFVRDGNTWKQQAKLLPGDAGGSDSFGEIVTILDDTLIVGAPGHSPNGIKFGGAAYVFVRDGETWRQQAKLVADDAERSDRFGASVGIGGDTIIVGSTLNDAGRGKDVGAAYIFVRDGNGWKQQAKLLGDKSKPGDHFGAGVATTGKIAVIGAPLREDDGLGAGAAYAFVNVDGVWEERKKIGPEEPEAGLAFGSAIAISGNTVIVTGGVAGDVPGFGNGSAAYVYSTIEDFDTPPFAVEPFGLRVTTLGQIKRTALFQNFPNPFNPETWLPYHLATDAPVTFRIYNVQGQLTRELDLGTQKSADYLTRETAAYWDGRDQFGEGVASGVYFYTLHAGSFQATRRMLILK